MDFGSTRGMVLPEREHTVGGRYTHVISLIGLISDLPRVRLPGAGGAPEIAQAAKEVTIVLKQSKRFVERLDFLTSSWHHTRTNEVGPGAATGRRPATVITDFAILQSDPRTRELVLTFLNPGVSEEQVHEATGWKLSVAPSLEKTASPTASELAVLRDLHPRTAAAHGDVGTSE